MKRFLIASLVASLAVPAALVAQDPDHDPIFSPYFFTTAAPIGPNDEALVSTAGAEGGGGQAEPSAYSERHFTRLTLLGGVSLLGTGAQVATNLPYKLDVRMLGNYTDFDWKETRSGFYVVVNIGMQNAGGFVDYYPWKSLRFSPGYLIYNSNRVRGDLQAQSGGTFTINNITYASDPANPVHGTGRLQLGGRGFMITTGWGHIVSRTEKHWSFPFEAGVAFINTPTISFNIQGDVCNLPLTVCRPATSFPGFESNLNTQLAEWNRRVRPFDIYPQIQGGVAYTFRFRR